MYVIFVTNPAVAAKSNKPLLSTAHVFAVTDDVRDAATGARVQMH